MNEETMRLNMEIAGRDRAWVDRHLAQGLSLDELYHDTFEDQPEPTDEDRLRYAEEAK